MKLISYILIIIAIIIALVFMISLDNYYESQGEDTLTARTSSAMIIWMIGIIMAPICYILFKLKMERALKKSKKNRMLDNSDNIEDNK